MLTLRMWWWSLSVRLRNRVIRRLLREATFPGMFDAAALVRLRENDVLVLRTQHSLNSDTIERLRKELAQYFGERKVLVLTDGLQIDIVRPASAPPGAVS